MKIINDILLGIGLLFLMLFIGGSFASIGVPAEYKETLQELGYGHYGFYGTTNVIAYIAYATGLISIVVGLFMYRIKTALILCIILGAISIGIAYLLWNIFLPSILVN